LISSQEEYGGNLKKNDFENDESSEFLVFLYFYFIEFYSYFLLYLMRYVLYFLGMKILTEDKSTGTRVMSGKKNWQKVKKYWYRQINS